MTFIRGNDRIPAERVKGMAKATLQALLTAKDKATDGGLRGRLRLLIRLGCENGFSLGLLDQSDDIGRLMLKANERSRMMGWL